jgi:hypothetical protein
MTEVRLQRARVGALVRQDKAGRMTQHVRMHLEADFGRVADQLGEPSDLNKNEWRLGLAL